VKIYLKNMVCLGTRFFVIRELDELGSDIHSITVRDSQLNCIEKELYKYTEQVCSYFWDHDIKYMAEYLTGSNLADLILDYSTSVNADLISIMTEQERSVSNLLLGTYAHQMITKAPFPVLSFPTYHLGNYAEDF
jgi:hypothetical protein